MSRKNKNGKRRNYTPKTYGRDFLTPTPIERAIQEANKPASPHAVVVSDRIGERSRGALPSARGAFPE